jgi:hypothetical protein
MYASIFGFLFVYKKKRILARIFTEITGGVYLKEQEGLKIQNGKFYVLKSKSENWIYINEDYAVDALKKMLAENGNLNSEDVSLLEVRIVGDEWEIKQVPWSKIAMLLIKR